VNIYFVLSVCVSKPAFCGGVFVFFIIHTFYLHSLQSFTLADTDQYC
jgi:hypothetical protein